MSRDLCLECRGYLYCTLADSYTDDCVLFEPSRLPGEREEDDDV